MIIRVRHGWLALITLPGLIVSPRQRALLREMRGFVRSQPTALQAPLPAALQQLTPVSSSSSESERTIRDLADLAALLDRRSPLGLCLRRSLTRYHFLRRAGIAVALQFGAKFKDGEPDRDISGHAWLTLDGRIYHEDGENWRGFTVMLSFPQPDVKISMEES